MNIIIPACGKGERFKTTHHNKLKPMIKVFEKEMIKYVIDNLNLSSEDKIFIIYNNNSFYIDNSNINLIKLENYTNGPAETVLLSLNEIRSKSNHKKCMIMDCDTFYTEDVVSLYRSIDENAIFYTKTTNEKPIFSYIEICNGLVSKIQEKVKISDNANTGIYCFNDIDILEQYIQETIKNNSPEFYISKVIHNMLSQNIKFIPIELNSSFVFNLGTPTQLEIYIKNTKAYLFDLDGTLIMSDDIYYSTWGELLQDYNITITAEIYETYIYGNSDEVVRDKLNLPDISLKKDQLFLKYIDHIRIVSNSIYFIKELKAKGNKIAVVTNSNRNIAETILKYINLDKYIDYLVIGNECKSPKPSPEPYLKAIEYFKIDKNSVIIFEDSKTGLLSASSISPKLIVGIETSYSKNELLNYGANFTLKNYENIDIDFLNSIQTSSSKVSKYISETLFTENVLINQNRIKGGFIADIFSVKIDNIDYIAKLESTNNTPILNMSKKLKLCEREYYFYQNLSKYVPIKIPKFYSLIKNSNFENIGILLEDISRFRINLNLNSENVDISLKIIDNLAKLHAHFWNKKLDIQTNKDYDWKEFIQQKWEIFKVKWDVSEKMKLVGDDIVTNFEKIQENLSDKNLTLCHGDVKSPNIFYDDQNNPYFIDWQYIILGKGVQDLVFFMIESFEPQTINKYFKLFTEYYYIKLLSYNRYIEYSKEEYILNLVNASYFFPFFVAMWFGTIDKDELIDKNFPYFYIKRLFSFYSQIDKNFN